jgi:cell division topological specificity factor
MKLFDFLTRRRSAPVARERLQILLEYERSLVNQTDLITVLREEILRIVARYVVIDPDTVQIKVNRGDTVSTLAVGVRIRNAARA